MNAFPILLGALCVYALAYRYYSAFHCRQGNGAG